MGRGISRRRFIQHSGGAIGAGIVAGIAAGSPFRASATSPYDYIIVEGHRDIWEFNDRFRLRKESQNSPLRDHLLGRLLEGGLNVVIMPAGGDSVPERGGDPRLLEGTMRVIDMLLTEVEKTNGVASIIRNKSDLPTHPDKNSVRIFLDLEGGASFQLSEPEPEFHPARRLAILRNFYRLGVRGVQLTHNGRNMLGSGIAEGHPGERLSSFGVEVVEEMNRLGMMIGVSHLSSAGIAHLAEITRQPIVSTHTNITAFMNTPRQHTDEDIRNIAATGGLIGVRYIVDETTYDFLADEIDYMVKLVGIDHVGVGWLGHDPGHPRTSQVPGFTDAPPPTGVEGQTMFEHWNTFIAILENRGYSEDELAKILGGNFLRVWKAILRN